MAIHAVSFFVSTDTRDDDVLTPKPKRQCTAASSCVEANQVLVEAILTKHRSWCSKGIITPISLLPTNRHHLIDDHFFNGPANRLVQYAIRCVATLIQQKNLPPFLEKFYQPGMSPEELMKKIPYLGSCSGESFALMVANDKKMRGDTRDFVSIVDKTQILLFQLLEHCMGRKDHKRCKREANGNLRVIDVRWMSGNPKIEQLNRKLIEQLAHVLFVGESYFDMQKATFETDLKTMILDPKVHVMEIGLFSDVNMHSMIVFLEPRCMLYDINHQALIHFNDRQTLFDEAMKYFKAQEQSPAASRYVTIQRFTHRHLAPELPEQCTLPRIDL